MTVVNEVVDDGSASSSPASSEAPDRGQVLESFANAGSQRNLIDDHDFFVDKAGLVQRSIGILLLIDGENASFDDGSLAVLDHGQASDNTSEGVSDRSQEKGEDNASEDERSHLERASIGCDCLARLGGAHGFVATAGEMVEHFSVHRGNVIEGRRAEVEGRDRNGNGNKAFVGSGNRVAAIIRGAGGCRGSGLSLSILISMLGALPPFSTSSLLPTTHSCFSSIHDTTMRLVSQILPAHKITIVEQRAKAMNTPMNTAVLMLYRIAIMSSVCAIT
ncbi:hypothetical protein KCU81_g82, partial [Aureobasidium melanogenum]